MPTRLDTNFPRLDSDDEFEQLICDLCRLEWQDPNTDRRGRSGQKQQGVDVYGQPIDAGGLYRGVQCKLRKTDKQPTEKEIVDEIIKARKFPRKLDILIIATDTPRDVTTQDIINKLSEKEQNSGGFKVGIWFWDSICERIASYNQIIRKYYRDYYSNITTYSPDDIFVDNPLQIIYDSCGKAGISPIEKTLSIWGIQVLQMDRQKQRNEISADGALIDCDFSGSFSTISLAKKISSHSQREYPTILIVNTCEIAKLQDMISELGVTSDQVFIFSSELSINELARSIFGVVFNFGYQRRGYPATIDITIRSSPTRPISTFLDANWQTVLSPNKFPSHSDWHNILVPALGDIFSFVSQQGDTTRIQFRPILPLPASFACGYIFNLRVARVGVWARETSVSDFKKQLWLSDAMPNDFVLNSTWIIPATPKPHIAIVELTNGSDIHEAVSKYIAIENVQYDGWMQIGKGNPDSRLENIDAETAVAFANQVGNCFREAIQMGITDFHLFMKMPSALALLIGQRLIACGRLHLYWFDNPSYQYAFTLS